MKKSNIYLSKKKNHLNVIFSRPDHIIYIDVNLEEDDILKGTLIIDNPLISSWCQDGPYSLPIIASSTKRILLFHKRCNMPYYYYIMLSFPTISIIIKQKIKLIRSIKSISLKMVDFPTTNGVCPQRLHCIRKTREKFL